jgi:mRNA interferase RelE/StbE
MLLTVQYRKKSEVIALIIKQAQKGALLRPDGNGIRLKGKLKEFGKIKNKAINLRIIYRPIELNDGIIEMQIIAIGPRDREEVYDKAKDRLIAFFNEVENRNKLT